MTDQSKVQNPCGNNSFINTKKSLAPLTRTESKFYNLQGDFCGRQQQHKDIEDESYKSKPKLHKLSSVRLLPPLGQSNDRRQSLASVREINMKLHTARKYNNWKSLSKLTQVQKELKNGRRRSTLQLSPQGYPSRRCSNQEQPASESQKTAKGRLQSLFHKLPELHSMNSADPTAYSVQRRRSRHTRRPDLFRKFKAAAWISILIRRLCQANLRNSEESDSPYMRDIKFVDNLVNKDKGNLLFNVEGFKANREMRMSEVSKRILTNPRWARTPQDLLHVQIVLRSIKDYADYPVAIQQKIAHVGEYRKYEARRIIVREGHPADNFYFILSGSVVILVMDEQRKFVKPKAILKRGQSFGELAIINGDRRRSTVVATEEVEMLCLWYEDYQAIFMDGGTTKSEDEFIQNLPFLIGWPVHLADEHPQLFRYHFYKRGEIVVRDSNMSTWIIVVKSGSLNVLKKLRKVEAFQWKKKAVLKAQASTSSSPEIPNSEKTTPQRKLTKRPTLHNSKSNPIMEVALNNLANLNESSFKQEIITAADDLDIGHQRGEHIQTEADIHPMFVHIQTLTKGQVLGLYDIVLGPQASFCVVSNGAECIMIDKNFFNSHLTDNVMKKIRSEAQAYPTDDELQCNLQVTVDWDAYKAATLKSAVERNQRQRSIQYRGAPLLGTL